MTKLRHRIRNRLSGMCGAINEKFSTNWEDPKNTKIQELEQKMDKTMSYGQENHGVNNQNFFKSSTKTYKRLR